MDGPPYAWCQCKECTDALGWWFLREDLKAVFVTLESCAFCFGRCDLDPVRHEHCLRHRIEFMDAVA